MNNRISIVIPAVCDWRKTKFYEYCQNQQDLAGRGIQFVFLQNLPFPPKPTELSEELTVDGVDVLVVRNDRYFASCEENLYRLQDIHGKLAEWVLVVGDHDEVTWPHLFEALDFGESNNLQAVALSVSNCQVVGSKPCEIVPIPGNQFNSFADNVVQALRKPTIVPSNIGFAALISNCGPIDWTAYVGSHVFRKQVLRRILAFEFPEYIYSFVFKQAEYFWNYPVRYGLFGKSCVKRISADFKMIKEGWSLEHDSWLGVHRTALGRSSFFWVSVLSHLTHLRDDSLFLVIANAVTACVQPKQGAEEMELQRYLFSLMTFDYCAQVIQRHQEGRSFYCKTPENRSLYDLNIVLNFIHRYTMVLSKLQTDDAKIKLIGPKLAKVGQELERYIFSDDKDALVRASNLLRSGQAFGSEEARKLVALAQGLLSKLVPKGSGA